MNFIPVDNIPRQRTRADMASTEHKPIREYIKEFMRMNVKYAKVAGVSREYSTIYTAKDSFRRSVVNLRLPIKVVVRQDELFLVRTDM